MGHTEFTRDISKWLNDKLKHAKLDVEIAEREEASCGGFEDCGGFYREQLVRARCEFNTLLSIKIGIEKIFKKDYAPRE